MHCEEYCQPDALTSKILYCNSICPHSQRVVWSNVGVYLSKKIISLQFA